MRETDFVNENNEQKVLQVDGDLNPTDIYTAISNNDWETVLAECFTNPNQARTWVVKYSPDDEGKAEKKVVSRFLPLHAAMSRNVPLQMAAAILMAYPDAVKEKDYRGMLPLHYACGSGAPEQCLAMLLMMYKQAAKTTEPQENSLPIHQLCQWGAISEEAIHLLLMAYPESIDAKDIHGKTPLDIICETREGEEAIELGKVLKRCCLAIGMNVEEEKDEQVNAKTEIMELEHKINAEQTNHANEKALLMSEIDTLQVQVDYLRSNTSATERQVTELQNAMDDEIDTLQVQVDYLRSNTSATERQVMELQNAMERLLGKQMDIEKKYSVATSNLAKLQAENGALDQEKRNLEEYLKQSVFIEKKHKQEISRLSDMLENYSDHNTILKSNVKSLTADLASRNEDIKEMTKKMNCYGKNFQEFYKDLEVQIEQMKIAARDRELVLEELLKDEKEKNEM
eukprot:CAMPEP_0172434154 /NCGR_PEP_ID=MMETSP1064-20121228/70479_1 /TAXON_ID=202472 /ORGANISM="Aulacoseira subarctica , Strain CCAP 1002/5" /LENGTH=455 /DNA_ID=CAMNT_0013182353 /DNA_START=81 /DNA_END=1446 /DNA_ORIENTATION=+